MPLKPKLFIASSSHGVRLATAVQSHLSSVTNGSLWNSGIFRVGETLIREVVERIGQHDFGVFLLTPDDITEIHNDSSTPGPTPSARDNVWLELGIGLGKLGQDRCFSLAPANVQLRIPSDVQGIIYARYDWERVKNDPRNFSECCAATQVACAEIESRITEIGTRASRSHVTAMLPDKSWFPFPPRVHENERIRQFLQVELQVYCYYCKMIAEAANQLVTVLTIEPRELVADILRIRPDETGPGVCGEESEASFTGRADRLGLHYSAYRQHPRGLRIVVYDGDAWIERNRHCLLPLRWLNGRMQCYVVERSNLVEAEPKIFLSDHTAVDNQICMYDKSSMTLTLVELDDVMSDQYFGYSQLKDDRLRRELGFVPLDDFLRTNGIDLRAKP